MPAPFTTPGPFRDKPFIPVDCGSLVPTLIESELFGYVKGAFTGANQSKDGLMAMAEGGTIFLDEVGELPVDLQAKMLRAIQEKEIRPVGSTRRVPINVRILAATNRDLEQAVMQGEFRRDLYFRLNVLSLRIPALRERRQDIPLLIGYFLDRMTRTSGLEKILSDEALKAMLAYDWPGNVRELENCLERTYAFTSGPLIHTTDLPREVANLPLPESSNGNGNGNGHGKIIPMAELEKKDDPERDHGTERRQAASCPACWASGRQRCIASSRTMRPTNFNLERPILNWPAGRVCHNGKPRCCRALLRSVFSADALWRQTCILERA